MSKLDKSIINILSLISRGNGKLDNDIDNGELTEYSSSDDEDNHVKVTKINKMKYDDDTRSMQSLHSLGINFWNIMDCIRRIGDESLNKAINMSKDELIKICNCNISQVEYNGQDYGIKNEKKSLKLLHKLGYRVSDLSDYFEPVDWSCLKDRDDEQKLIQQKSDNDSIENHNKFMNKLSVSNTVPWFAVKKGKKQKPSEEFEYIYKDVYVNCLLGSTGSCEWSGSYCLNVAKSKNSATLFYSLVFSKKYTKNDTNHPLNLIYENKKNVANENSESEDDEAIGDWVNDNELTRTMFKWLAMSNETMNKEIEHVSYSRYRKNLLQCLDNLWY